jgi:hypothetical protein
MFFLIEISSHPQSKNLISFSILHFLLVGDKKKTNLFLKSKTLTNRENKHFITVKIKLL